MKNRFKAVKAILGLALLLASVAPAALAQTTQTTPASSTIKDIKFEKVDSQLQVLITVDGAFTFETLEVQAPQRLVIDFKSVSQIAAPPVLEVNDLGVVSIRTGQFQPDVARVVFDLADPAPAHSLTQTETGLKVLFWQEAAQPPAQPEVKEAPPVAEPAKPVEPQPQEEKPAVQAPVAEAGRNFFVRLAGGLALPAMPDTSGITNINLYFEPGSLNETYSLKTGYRLDLAFGKYFTPGIRAGIGVGFGSANTTSNIVGTLPHPFLMNQPRTVNFPANELSNNLLNVYAFGLFTIVRADKFELSVGPMLGYGSSNYKVLQDFTLTDVSPFAASNVTITSQTFSDETVSMLSAGAWVAGQYQVAEKLFVTLDARLFYFDPKVEIIGHSANLSSIDILVGLQYNF